jgi:hypothetical protein
MRLGVFALLGTSGLALGTGAAAYLLLQACAVNWAPLRAAAACEPPVEALNQERLAVLDASNAELTRRIFELERELAGQQCLIPALDPNAPLTPEGWAARDLRMFYGCWALDSTYRTRDVDSGAIRTYSGWQMCFDAEGRGTQSMRSADGITCEGPVTAGYAGQGEGQGLSIREGGNLACSDGGFIHERQITCTAAPRGRATCATLQPETGGAADVGFQRPG